MNKIVLLLSVLVAFSCGKHHSDDDAAGPAPAPSNVAWEQVQPVVQANCGGCHDGVKHKPKLDSADAFKHSASKKMIVSGKMPPKDKLKDADKDLLLSFLGGCCCGDSCSCPDCHCGDGGCNGGCCDGCGDGDCDDGCCGGGCKE